MNERLKEDAASVEDCFTFSAFPQWCRREEKGSCVESGGRGCCSLGAVGENDAAAVLGGCRQKGWRDAGGGGEVEGALAQSALSDVAFSGSKPIRRLTAVLSAPK